MSEQSLTGEKTLRPAGPYPPEGCQRDDSIGYLINAVRARLSAALDAKLEPFGLTGAQWVTLMSIHNGAETAVDSCRNVGCDTGSMTRMLDRLEEKGLIRRERSAADRRVVNLVLTDAGRAVPKQAMPVVTGVLNACLDGFSGDEFELLKAFLRRLLANAERI